MSPDRLQVESARGPAVVIGGRELRAFAGCDYLGLSCHPRVLAALRTSLEHDGLSPGGSRLTSGNRRVHEELEAALASFVGMEAALLAPAGYLANLFVAQMLASTHRSALFARDSHVSMRDALGAASIAVREFGNVEDARRVVKSELAGPLAILTDGVFPARKRIAPLTDLLALVARLDVREATLVVDDCHGLGVLGARGRGTLEHFGLSDPRIVLTGTLSKSLGVFGGFVAGRRELIERIAARSQAFAGSTPLPAAMAHAALAALNVLASEPEHLTRLRSHIGQTRERLRALGLSVHDLPLPVFALALESPKRCRAVHEELLAQGLLVPYVEYPDGLGGYLRLALSAAHTEEDLARLFAALQKALSVVEAPR